MSLPIFSQKSTPSEGKAYAFDNFLKRLTDGNHPMWMSQAVLWHTTHPIQDNRIRLLLGVAAGPEDAEGRLLHTTAYWHNQDENSPPSTSEVLSDMETRMYAAILNDAIIQRDSGNTDKAVATLSALAEALPERSEAFIEALIICNYVKPDHQAAGKVLNTLHRHPRTDPRLDLLAAEHYCKIGDLKTFAEIYRPIAHVEFSDPHFQAWQKRLPWVAVRTTFERTLEVYRTLSLPIHPDVVKSFFASELSLISHGEEFRTSIQHLTFYNVMALQDPFTPLTQSLIDLVDQLKGDKLGWALLFLYANRRIEDYSRLTAVHSDHTAAARNPVYLKAAFLYATLTGDKALENSLARTAFECLPEFQAKVNTADATQNTARIIEVLSRAYHISDPGVVNTLPNAEQAVDLIHRYGLAQPSIRGDEQYPESDTIFFGIFGQLRFAEDTVPGLVQYCYDAVAAFNRDTGSRFNATIALATWNKSGVRNLLDHGGIHAFFERLPVELVSLCRQEGVDSVSRFEQLLPNIYQRILIGSSASTEVDAAAIERLSSRIDMSDIGDEVATDEQISSYITTAYPNGDAPSWLRNQLKMWNRIYALGTQLRAWEKQHNQRIRAAVVVRGDLKIHNASFAPLLRACLATDRRHVIVDHDPNAEFSEGIGDRYFVATRDVILKTCELWEHFVEILTAPDDRYAPFKARMPAHQLIASYLFQLGIDVFHVTRQELNFDIFRGRLSLDDLRSEIQSDAACTASVTLQSRLLQL